MLKLSSKIDKKIGEKVEREVSVHKAKERGDGVSQF